MFDILKAPAEYTSRVNEFIETVDTDLVSLKEVAALAVTAIMADVYAHKAEKNAIRAVRMRRRTEVHIDTYNFRQEMKDL